MLARNVSSFLNRITADMNTLALIGFSILRMNKRSDTSHSNTQDGGHEWENLSNCLHDTASTAWRPEAVQLHAKITNGGNNLCNVEVSHWPSSKKVEMAWLYFSEVPRRRDNSDDWRLGARLAPLQSAWPLIATSSLAFHISAPRPPKRSGCGTRLVKKLLCHSYASYQLHCSLPTSPSPSSSVSLALSFQNEVADLHLRYDLNQPRYIWQGTNYGQFEWDGARILLCGFCTGSGRRLRFCRRMTGLVKSSEYLPSVWSPDFARFCYFFKIDTIDFFFWIVRLTCMYAYCRVFRVSLCTGPREELTCERWMPNTSVFKYGNLYVCTWYDKI